MSKTPADLMMDSVNWEVVDCEPSTDGIPHVTHQGVIILGDISLKCYQLSSGERVIDGEDMNRLFSDLPSE